VRLALLPLLPLLDSGITSRHTPAVETDILTIAQACQRVQVSRRTIYNWIQAGKLPVLRTLGGGPRIREADLWRVDAPATRAGLTPRGEVCDAPRETREMPEPRLGPRQETSEEWAARIEGQVAVLVAGVARERQRQQQESPMGTFNLSITASGGHGCERKAKPGEKLYGRCGRFGCSDCMAYEFVQEMRQKGMLQSSEAQATFTHWPGQPDQVVDDLLTNTRKSGSF
jgi:excisionase family DNA binding protein